MEGRNCQITIDTGSNISIVRPDVLPEKKQSEIQPINQCIRTVTGEKAPIRGKGNLRLRIGSVEIVHPIRIGSTEIVHPTWIADIQDECILGLDFLEPHECLVNLRNGTLQVGEEEIPMQKPAVVTTLTPCRAVLETTVILPPQSECVVPAKMDGQWKHKPRWGIMEAGTRNKEAESALEGLLVARTLVDLHQPTTVMRMMNLTWPETQSKEGNRNCKM